LEKKNVNIDRHDIITMRSGRSEDGKRLILRCSKRFRRRRRGISTRVTHTLYVCTRVHVHYERVYTICRKRLPGRGGAYRKTEIPLDRREWGIGAWRRRYIAGPQKHVYRVIIYIYIYIRIRALIVE